MGRIRVDRATVQEDRTPRPGDREPDVVGCRGLAYGAEPAHRDLDAGGVLVGADEPVGGAQCRPVGGSGDRDARRERARPPLVLHGGEQPRREDADRGRIRIRSSARGRCRAPMRNHRRTETTLGMRCLGAQSRSRGQGGRRRGGGEGHEADEVAGLEERGGRGIRIEQRRRGRADQLPPAGRRAGVRAGERAGEADRAGRNAGARTCTSRHVEPPVGAHEIAEPRREAREGDRPARRGVPAHQLGGADLEQGCRLREVVAVVDHRDLDRAGRARRRGRPVGDGRGDPRSRRRQRQNGGIDDHQHRPRGRDEVDDPVDAPGRQPRVEGEHALEPIRLDEQAAVAERADGDGVGHHGGATAMPAASRARRTARAIPTAPGESPCTHSDTAPVSSRVPSTASTTPSRASRTARSAT